MGYDVDWGGDLTPNATPGAIAQFAFETFIRGSGHSYTVNLNHALKNQLLASTAFNKRFRLLQAAKLYIASGFARDFPKNYYETQITYIKNIWAFNGKFLHGHHYTDIGPSIQTACDRVLNDGMTYADISDTSAL